jgi:hypothetical protein
VPHAAPLYRLSQQLADLSVRAKSAEDAVAAAEKEAHAKIETPKEQARAAAAKAAKKVSQEITSAGDTAVRNWTTVRFLEGGRCPGKAWGRVVPWWRTG